MTAEQKDSLCECCEFCGDRSFILIPCYECDKNCCANCRWYSRHYKRFNCLLGPCNREYGVTVADYDSFHETIEANTWRLSNRYTTLRQKIRDNNGCLSVDGKDYHISEIHNIKKAI